ncbi:MAG: endolytic transglycosylase MltG [Lachnospiraceae bacterium]|nr:endolytic transglycosylase MltG [Lachnospiraceae bacterium]
MKKGPEIKIIGVIMTFLGMMVRILLVIVCLYYIYKGAIWAYGFGYRIFTEEPVSSGDGVEVEITIPDGSSAMDIGEILEERGLIRDKKLFFVQEFLSAYHKKMESGTYTLSTAMTAEEMMAEMTPDTSSEEEEESD